MVVAAVFRRVDLRLALVLEYLVSVLGDLSDTTVLQSGSLGQEG